MSDLYASPLIDCEDCDEGYIWSDYSSDRGGTRRRCDNCDGAGFFEVGQAASTEEEG